MIQSWEEAYGGMPEEVYEPAWPGVSDFLWGLLTQTGEYALSTIPGATSETFDPTLGLPPGDATITLSKSPNGLGAFELSYPGELSLDPLTVKRGMEGLWPIAAGVLIVLLLAKD